MNVLHNIIHSSQIGAISYTLLIVNYIACFWNKSLTWPIVFLCYLSFAFIVNKITLIGLLIASIFFLLVYCSKVSRNVLIKYLCCMGIFAWSILAMIHLLPGFNNMHIIINKQITASAIPYNLYINFDKPIIGIVLYGLLFHKSRGFVDVIKIVFKSGYIVILAITTILAVSYISGFVKMEFKYPNFFKVWLILNIITVITEEVFFRGWLLNLFREKYPVWLSIITTSLIFGLLHFRGGYMYIVLATVASIFYSYIYVKTKYIESSIILHLLVNIIHILFFTYPALAL